MTPRPSARFCIPRAALLLFVCAGNMLGAQQRPADTTLGTVLRVRTVRSAVSGTQPRSNVGEGLLVRSRGARQRVDVLRGIDDTVGTEWISTGATPREMRIHSVAQRTTVVMKFTDVQEAFTSILQTRFDSATAEAEVLGAGPRLLGHATQRVVFRRGFRMQSSKAGKTQTLRVTSEIDALIAPDVPESVAANSALSLTSGSTADLVEQIFGAGSNQVVVRNGAALPTGLALRSVSRSRVVSSGAGLLPFGATGDSAVTIDSVEVLSIAQQPVADAVFAEPVGYEVVDFGDQMRTLMTMMDSLSTSLGALGKNSKPVKPAAARPKPASKPYKP
jgi:hypothetical protein